MDQNLKVRVCFAINMPDSGREKYGSLHRTYLLVPVEHRPMEPFKQHAGAGNQSVTGATRRPKWSVAPASRTGHRAGSAAGG